MADSKGARVAELWEGPGLEGGWNFCFERSFNDWELDIVQCFICTVSSKRLNPLIRDRLLWKEVKDGIFIVKSSFVFLEGGRQQLVPVKMLWNPCVLTKVCFFAWEVWWGKVLTSNQLKKRGFSLASRCPFCGKAEEVMEHIFIHCPMIWRLWIALFVAHGDGWVSFLLVKDLIFGWDCLPSRKKEYRLWRAAPLCLMWAIWKERNTIIFEDDCFVLDRLKSLS